MASIPLSEVSTESLSEAAGVWVGASVGAVVLVGASVGADASEGTFVGLGVVVSNGDGAVVVVVDGDELGTLGHSAAQFISALVQPGVLDRFSK